MTFRFIGTECQIGEHPILREFGEKIELLPEIAREVIGSPVGAAVLPDPVFGALDFTADELAVHKWVASHDEAPEEFQAKKKSALIALDKLRARLMAGESFDEEQV